VREIAQKLTQEKIKPWLDEADIRVGNFWHTTIGQQIETVKAAAVLSVSTVLVRGRTASSSRFSISSTDEASPSFR
jgi:hypothetical protein